MIMVKIQVPDGWDDNEKYAEAQIEELLRSRGWDPLDKKQVRFQYSGDRKRSDYMLFDTLGNPLCVIEAKKPSLHPYDAKEQALEYANQANADFIILSNGHMSYLWELKHPEKLDAQELIGNEFPTREDLEKKKEIYDVPSRPLTDLKLSKDFLKEYRKDISLYQYQIDAIEEVSKQFDQDKKRAFLLEMATGTGKTLVSAGLILRFLKTNNAQRVLFIVDRIDLAKQAKEDFDVILQDYAPVIYKNARKKPMDLAGSSVVIATIQSLMNGKKYKEDFSPFHFDLVINDEAHRSIYGDSKEAVQYFQGTRIGLTATPNNYLHNVNLGEQSSRAIEARALRDTYHFFECEPKSPTFKYDIISAVKDPEGPFLCQPKIYRINSNISTEAMSKQGWEVEINEKEENYKIQDLEKKISVPLRNKLMCERLLEKALHAPDGKIGKTIVFCVSQYHATVITQILNKIEPESAVLITSRVKSASDIAKDFRDGNRKERIAVSVDMLTTGYNCRDLLNVALFRPVFSPTEYIQIKGRGTRLYTFEKNNKIIGKKKYFHLLDFCGVTNYFENEYDFEQSPPEPLINPGKGGTGGNGGGDDPPEIPPIWEGEDYVVDEDQIIVGPEGEKIDVMTYRARFEDSIKNLIDLDPELREATDEEDFEKIEEILNRNFLNRPKEYFSEEKLMKAYDVPATLLDFILSAIGKKNLPTKTDISSQTASSLGSRFNLSYEHKRWIETTVNLLLEDSVSMKKFISEDYINLFNNSQFLQLGGINSVKNDFEKIREVLEALRESTIIQKTINKELGDG